MRGWKKGSVPALLPLLHLAELPGRRAGVRHMPDPPFPQRDGELPAVFHNFLIPRVWFLGLDLAETLPGTGQGIVLFQFRRRFVADLGMDAEPGADAGIGHPDVIALDVSYSMAVLDHMEEAAERALAIVDELPVGDRVAVVAFGRVATIDSPLSYPDETENDSVRRARRVIRELRRKHVRP